jgi:cytochrome P450
VHWSEAWGSWVLTRYDDVLAMLRDPRSFSNVGRSAAVERVADDVREQLAPLFANFRVGMPSTDPPQHTRIRTLVNKAFLPRTVQNIRQRVECLVDELIDRVASRGRMDLIADFAHPLPATVIAEIMGLPLDERDRLRDWSQLIIAYHGTARPDPAVGERSLQAFLEAREWLRALLSARRREPRDDLLSALVAAEERGDMLTETEVISTLITLMTAGHETTTGLIGNGMLALFEHPAAFEQLRTEPDKLPSAVEELLRFDAPFPRAWRRTHESIELGGRMIEAGAMVNGLLGAANRDPAQFPEPDRLDLGRAPNRHLSFGIGTHFCLGAPLARLEGQVALGSLLRRLRGLRPGGEPARQASITFRGLASLPVEFDAVVP